MPDPIDTLQTRYPDLFALLECYFQRMVSLGQTSKQRFWLWRVARLLAEDPEHWIRDVIGNLDRIAKDVSLDARDAAELRRRLENCLPARLGEYRTSYDDHVLDAFTEMLGYQYLALKGYVDIHFVPTGTDKAPDLTASPRHGRKPAVMECKNVHRSQQERRYFAYSQGTVRQVRVELASPDVARNPLLSKLLDTAGRAVAQLADYDGDHYRRLVFLNYSPDAQMVILRADLPHKIERVFGEVAAEVNRQDAALILTERYDPRSMREFPSPKDKREALEDLLAEEHDLGSWEEIKQSIMQGKVPRLDAD